MLRLQVSQPILLDCHLKRVLIPVQKTFLTISYRCHGCGEWAGQQLSTTVPHLEVFSGLQHCLFLLRFADASNLLYGEFIQGISVHHCLYVSLILFFLKKLAQLLDFLYSMREAWSVPSSLSYSHHSHAAIFLRKHILLL